MQQTLITKVTDLGDPTLLLLGGMGLFFWSGADQHEVARPWAMAFGLCIFLTIVSKVVVASRLSSGCIAPAVPQGNAICSGARGHGASQRRQASSPQLSPLH